MNDARQHPWRLQIHETVGSTSDLCRTLASRGEPEGLVVLARQQTGGRGSRGRGWNSPLGNLYLSVLLRPRESARDAGQWSLLAGVALVEALAPYLPDPSALRLKWPNDVLLCGAKLAGILVDSVATPAGDLDYLVIGIGVNLAVAPDIPGRATACVADVAPPPPAEALARGLLTRLDAWRRARARDGFADVRAAWLRLAAPLGGPTTLRLGGRLVEGRFAGLADDGSLLLDNQGHVAAFTTGEVLQ